MGNTDIESAREFEGRLGEWLKDQVAHAYAVGAYRATKGLPIWV